LSHLTAEDVGRRVSIRRRTASHLSDVVGQLIECSDEQLVVRRADGSTASVPRDSIVAARLVTAARAEIPVTVAELEEIAARGWPSPDTAWIGRWWLRAADGFTGRANSVLPLGSPGMPLDEALSVAIRWYEGRHLPARFLLEIDSPLDVELAERGWVEPKRRYGGVLVQTASMAPAIVAVSALTDPALPPVTTSAVPSEEWLAMYRDGAALCPTARAVIASHPRVRFAEMRDDGRLVAIGRVAVDDRWAGVSAVDVDPGWRRRGIATAVGRQLLTQAWQLGARRAYLQVEEGNLPAIRLYERIGFTTHHRYHYRVQGDAG
jgi:GNAT superfamily N-acetyltransferase